MKMCKEYLSECSGWNCPICNSNSFLEITKYRAKSASSLFAGKNFVVCSQCNAGSMSPLPTNEDFNDYYNDYWEEDALNLISTFEMKQAESRVEFLKDYLLEFNELSILDIGAGRGLTFEAIRKSFQGKTIKYDAVEVSCKAVDYLKEHIKPRKIYSDYHESDSKYSLIFLSHIIEHFADPVEFLREQKARMNYDSLLFIEVPNQDHRFKDHNEPHIISFTPASLICALERAGYSVLQIATVGQPIDSIRSRKCISAQESDNDGKKTISICRRGKSFVQKVIRKLLRKIKVIDIPKEDGKQYLFLREYGQDRQWIRCVAKIDG